MLQGLKKASALERAKAPPKKSAAELERHSVYAVKLVLNIISLALNAAIFVLIALPIIDRSGFLQVDWRPELTFATELALAPAIKSQASAPPAQFDQRISFSIARLEAPQLGQHQTVSS
jgi:hypothetical protein